MASDDPGKAERMSYGMWWVRRLDSKWHRVLPEALRSSIWHRIVLEALDFLRVASGRHGGSGRHQLVSYDSRRPGELHMVSDGFRGSRRIPDDIT